MFVGPVIVCEPFPGVFQAESPIAFTPESPGAPLAITVPEGFRSRLEMVPPPLRRKLRTDSPATPAALLYAYLLSVGEERSVATSVLQEALRKRGVRLLDRWLFRLVQ